MNEYLEEYEKNCKWMEEHDFDGCLWPEEATFVDAFEKGQAVERAKAFGAIRRAAEVIREAERLHLCKYEANYIRAAIRAAIGSDKRDN